MIRHFVLKGKNMTTLTASQARTMFYKLMDTVSLSHAPVRITGRHSDVVLISVEDWSAIQETLHLSSIPGMKETIVKGMKTPVKKFSKELKW